MRAMILAAGLGTRMRPLTLHTPKPLLPAGGRPLIEYHIERLVQAGVDRIVINHSWLGEQLVQTLGDGERFGVELCYSAEPEPLETAGGVRQALHWLADSAEDSFILVNGDVFTEAPLQPLLQRELPEEVDAHLLLVSNPAWHLQGDFVLQAGCVYAKAPLGASADMPERLTFSGISRLRARLLQGLRSGDKAPLAPLLREAMARAAVTGERLQGYWNDIGTPQRLAELDQRLRAATGAGADNALR